jgi:hypothetical protein
MEVTGTMGIKKGTLADAKGVDINLLKSKALMVRLTTKKISRNKMDKDLAILIHDLKKVSDKAALRVNKSIFPKEHTDMYQKVQAEAKKYFYNVTTPWDDKGWRLLAVDIFADFAKKMKAYSTEFKEKVYHFIDNIEGSIEAMKEPLGEAFNKDDYEHLFNRDGSVNRDHLLKQFNLETEFDTVTTGNDLRASLTDHDKKLLTDEINDRAEKKFAASQAFVIQKLYDTVAKMHERLSSADNMFRDTLVSNIEELCDLIPVMNIAGDPALDEMAAEAKVKLTKWDAQTLRDDDEARKEVCKEADKLAKNMVGML